MVMSSVASAHTPLEIVHLKVALDPAANPVMVEPGDAGEVIDTLPLTIDHAPVPTVGVLAAMVKVELLHKV
jgi:predicted secreted protein